MPARIYQTDYDTVSECPVHAIACNACPYAYALHIHVSVNNYPIM